MPTQTAQTTMEVTFFNFKFIDFNFSLGYTCACRSGFSGDGFSCNDIDECSADVSPCDPNGTCTNSEGSFGCACNNGYSGDGFACVSVCTFEETCVDNTQCSLDDVGNVNCDCSGGFEWATDSSGDCVDIDECQFGPCDENASCSNNHGSFACACNSGWIGNGIACENVDECLNADACPANSDCHDQPGAYNCVAHDGYKLHVNDDGTLTTVDINECLADVGPCHDSGICTNTVGSFECSCPETFEGTGFDLCLRDECALGGFCGANTDCTDTAEAFT